MVLRVPSFVLPEAVPAAVVFLVDRDWRRLLEVAEQTDWVLVLLFEKERTDSIWVVVVVLPEPQIDSEEEERLLTLLLLLQEEEDGTLWVPVADAS